MEHSYFYFYYYYSFIWFFLVHGKASEFYMFILNPAISLNSPHRSNSLLVECLGLSKKQVMMMSEN